MKITCVLPSLYCSVEEGSTQRVGLLQSLFYTTVEEVWGCGFVTFRGRCEDSSESHPPFPPLWCER